STKRQEIMSLGHEPRGASTAPSTGGVLSQVSTFLRSNHTTERTCPSHVHRCRHGNNGPFARFSTGGTSPESWGPHAQPQHLSRSRLGAGWPGRRSEGPTS